MEENGVPGQNHRLIPSHWQLSRIPLVGFRLGQWREIASSQWQRLRPHGHQGSLNRRFNTMKFFHSVSGLKVHIKIVKAIQLGEKGDSSINKIGDE